MRRREQAEAPAQDQRDKAYPEVTGWEGSESNQVEWPDEGVEGEEGDGEAAGQVRASIQCTTSGCTIPGISVIDIVHGACVLTKDIVSSRSSTLSPMSAIFEVFRMKGGSQRFATTLCIGFICVLRHMVRWTSFLRGSQVTNSSLGLVLCVRTGSCLLPRHHNPIEFTPPGLSGHQSKSTLVIEYCHVWDTG